MKYNEDLSCLIIENEQGKQNEYYNVTLPLMKFLAKEKKYKVLKREMYTLSDTTRGSKLRLDLVISNPLNRNINLMAFELKDLFVDLYKKDSKNRTGIEQLQEQMYKAQTKFGFAFNGSKFEGYELEMDSEGYFINSTKKIHEGDNKEDFLNVLPNSEELLNNYIKNFIFNRKNNIKKQISPMSAFIYLYLNKDKNIPEEELSKIKKSLVRKCEISETFEELKIEEQEKINNLIDKLFDNYGTNQEESIKTISELDINSFNYLSFDIDNFDNKVKIVNELDFLTYFSIEKNQNCIDKIKKHYLNFKKLNLEDNKITKDMKMIEEDYFNNKIVMQNIIKEDYFNKIIEEETKICIDNHEDDKFLKAKISNIVKETSKNDLEFLENLINLNNEEKKIKSLFEDFDKHNIYLDTHLKKNLILNKEKINFNLINNKHILFNKNEKDFYQEFNDIIQEDNDYLLEFFSIEVEEFKMFKMYFKYLEKKDIFLTNENIKNIIKNKKIFKDYHEDFKNISSNNDIDIIVEELKNIESLLTTLNQNNYFELFNVIYNKKLYNIEDSILKILVKNNINIKNFKLISNEINKKKKINNKIEKENFSYIDSLNQKINNNNFHEKKYFNEINFIKKHDETNFEDFNLFKDFNIYEISFILKMYNINESTIENLKKNILNINLKSLKNDIFNIHGKTGKELLNHYIYKNKQDNISKKVAVYKYGMYWDETKWKFFYGLDLKNKFQENGINLNLNFKNTTDFKNKNIKNIDDKLEELIKKELIKEEELII